MIEYFPLREECCIFGNTYYGNAVHVQSPIISEHCSRSFSRGPAVRRLARNRTHAYHVLVCKRFKFNKWHFMYLPLCYLFHVPATINTQHWRRGSKKKISLFSVSFTSSFPLFNIKYGGYIS